MPAINPYNRKDLVFSRAKLRKILTIERILFLLLPTTQLVGSFHTSHSPPYHHVLK